MAPRGHTFGLGAARSVTPLPAASDHQRGVCVPFCSVKVSWYSSGLGASVTFRVTDDDRVLTFEHVLPDATNVPQLLDAVAEAWREYGPMEFFPPPPPF